jgi:hypothetical protein
MTEDADVRAARDALALAKYAGAPAAAAARRAVRRHLLLMGSAMAAAILASGLITHAVDARLVWLRALAVGLAWGTLVAGAYTLLNAQPVRALAVRHQTITVGLAGAVVLGITLAVGADHVVAYPIGALGTFAVWALGAVWVGR